MTDNEALKSLHNALIDAKTGYATALNKSDVAATTAVFRDMLAFHQRAHRSVHDALLARRERPEEDGTFMGTVNKIVVSARSAITGLTEGSLASFASGEEHVISRYDDAIKEVAADSALRTELSRQRETLSRKITEMKQIATSHSND